MSVTEYDQIHDQLEEEKGADLSSAVVSKSSRFFGKVLDEVESFRGAAVKSAFSVAQETDPQQQADIINLSNLYEVSPDLIKNDLDFYKKNSRSENVNVDDLMEKAPHTSTFAADANNAALINAELQDIVEFETGVKNLTLGEMAAQAWDVTSPHKGVGIGLKVLNGVNNLMTSFTNTSLSLGLISPSEAAFINAELYRNGRTLQSHMPNYVRDFDKMVQEKGPELDKNFSQFSRGTKGLFSVFVGEDQNRSIKDLVTDVGYGGFGTVVETVNFVKALKDHKMGTAAFIAENLPNTAVTMIPALWASKALKGIGFAGRIIGLSGGSFVAAFPIEYGAQISQEMAKKNIDLTDPNALFNVYTDPGEMTKMRKKGFGKGLGTAGTDALLSLFLLGRLSRWAAGKNIAIRALAASGDVGIDMLSESFTEGLGQVATGDDVSFTEMVLEGLAAGPQSVVEVTAAKGIDITKNLTPELSRKELQAAYDDAMFHVSGQEVRGPTVRNRYVEDPYEAMEDIASDADNATQSLNEINTLYALGKKVKGWNVIKKVKAKVIEIMKEMVPAGQTVLMSIKVFDEYWTKQNIPPIKVAEQLLGENINEYHSAKKSGSSFAIPLSNFLAELAPTPHFENLVPKVKMRENALGPEQLKTFLDALPRTMDEVMNEIRAADPDPISKAAAEVRENLEAQVRKTKRFSDAQVTAAGNLLESTFLSFATRTNVPIEELKKRFSFLIENLPKEDPTVQFDTETGEVSGLNQILTGKIFGRYTPDVRKITFFKRATIETLLHEMSHGFFQNMDEISDAAPKDSQLFKDWTNLKKWAGVKPGKKATKAQSEKLSEAFVKYLETGKAPTTSLQRAFELFKQWIAEAYAALTGLNVELNPEVTDIFDRLIASDFEIAAAKEEAGIEDFPAEIFSSKKEADKYNDSIREQLHEAVAIQRKLYFAEMRRSGRKTELYKKTRAEVAEEAIKDRRFVAVSIMTTGKFPDGSETNLPKVKLNRQDVVNEFGEEFLERLPKGIVVRRGGVHQQVAAVPYGFADGTDMLAALEDLPTFNQYVENETSRKLAAMDDSFWPGSKSFESALEALQNTKRELILRNTMKLLAESNFNDVKKLVKGVVNRKVPTNDQIKAEARQIVLREKVFRFTPNKYLLNQRKFSKKALKAILDGDIETALEAKRKEFLNYYAYKDAVDFQGQVQVNGKIPTFLKTFLKKSTRTRVELSKFGHLRVIDSLLERFGFKGPPTEEEISDRVPIKQFSDEHYSAYGVEPVLSPRMMDETFSTPYTDLTIEEAFELRDAVKNLNHLSIQIRKFLKQKEFETLAEFVRNGVAQIDANNRKNELTLEESFELYDKEKEEPGSTKPPKDRKPVERVEALRNKGAKNLTITAIAPLLKVSTILRKLDGNVDLGFFTRNIMFLLDEAANQETQLQLDAFKSLDGVFNKAFTRKELLLMRKNPERIDELGTSLPRMAQLAYVLNAGNVEGADRVGNEGFTDDKIQILIDRFSDKEIDFLNEIWALLESYWPETKALAERSDALTPPKVVAVKRKHKSGKVLTGGFYPLDYDALLSQSENVPTDEQLKRKFKGGQFARAQVAHNHRKARVAKFKDGIVRLDFSVMFKHMQYMIHDLTHYEAMRDIDKIFRNKEIKNAIIENYGVQYLNELMKGFDDIAIGDAPARDFVDTALNYFRAGQAISTMAYSATTAMIQPLGIPQGMARVGSKWVLKGMSRWLGDATRMENTVQMIYKKSLFMKNRAKTLNREIRDIMKQFTVKGAITIPGTKISLSDITGSGFALMAKTQLAADVPIWLGAYEKAMEQIQQENPNMDVFEMEELAVKAADRGVIDSQASGHIKDLARIQRGGAFHKIWTVYLTFFQATFNVLISSIGRTNFRDVSSVGLLAVDVLLLTTLPATLETIVRSTLRGDDDEDLIERILENNFSYAIGMLPGVREFDFLIRGYRGYSGPAGIQFISDLGDVVTQAKQLEADEAFFRALNRAAGTYFHYPSSQVDRTVRGIIQLGSGESINPFAVLVGPPPKGKGKDKELDLRSLGG